MTESLDLLTPYFPVYASSDSSSSLDVLDPGISAILGGNKPVLEPGEKWPHCAHCSEHLIPYIQINASSLHTPEEFRTKLAAEPQPGQTAVFQVFICADNDHSVCFDQTLISAYHGAWLIRVLHAVNTSSAAVEEMRSEMDPDKFFIKKRVIAHWTAGRSEVEHEMVNLGVEEELYDQYQPASGLKLFGWPIRGKYYTSIGECSAPDRGESGSCDWYCLIQLGTNGPYNPETNESPGEPVHTAGNTYVDYCTRHPGVFAMTISDDW